MNTAPHWLQTYTAIDVIPCTGNLGNKASKQAADRQQLATQVHSHAARVQQNQIQQQRHTRLDGRVGEYITVNNFRNKCKIVVDTKQRKKF